MGFRQIQAPTLRELFVDQVIGMIFSGELKVGDRLPSERELSEQMHISRSMVHTGLEDLERMGFVRMEARRGNYIEDYARHGNFETLMALAKYGGEIDHAIESSLVEARDAIEGGAMLLLGERGTPEDMQQLHAITDGLRAAVDAGEGNAVYARWMRRFDTTIAELSGNRIFPLLMNSLADVSGVLWERCVGFWGAETVIEQELRIIDMLSAGRGRDAALYIENIYHHYCDAHADAWRRTILQTPASGRKRASQLVRRTCFCVMSGSGFRDSRGCCR